VSKASLAIATARAAQGLRSFAWQAVMLVERYRPDGDEVTTTTVLIMTPPAVWKRSRLPGTCICSVQESLVAETLNAPETSIAATKRSANSFVTGSADWTSKQTFGSPCGTGLVACPEAAPAAKHGLERAAIAAATESLWSLFISEDYQSPAPIAPRAVPDGARATSVLADL